MQKYIGKLFTPVYANDNDAYIPEVWANESLMQLENNMVASALVHRDFSSEIASFGDTVNTRRPSQFTAVRKVDGDAVTNQDAIAINVAVKLDQHLHTSFIIFDGEESKGFKNLVQEYLEPAARSLAQALDEIVLGQMYEFIGNSAGMLGTGLDKATVIDAREVLTTNQAPQNGRNMIIGPSGEADLLNISEFVTADKVGDEGSALREGSLGRKYGFQIHMDQNSPSVLTGGDSVTGAINNAAGYLKGAKTVAVDGLVAAIDNNSWFTVAGDLTPQRVVSTVGGATPTSITFEPGLQNAVVDDAVVTVIDSALVNNAGGYLAGYAKTITIDDISVAPQKGQLVYAGNGEFSVLSGATLTGMVLNRPLDVAIADDEALGLGPAGDYNFAFHRNSVALVNRPLAAPMAGAGARSFVASFNGLSMRVTITYDGQFQGHRVTLDMLCGVKLLDKRLGCIVYS